MDGLCQHGEPREFNCCSKACRIIDYIDRRAEKAAEDRLLPTSMRFTEHQIRRALLGFCGANQNNLLHYLAFSAAVENEAALNSGKVPDDFTTEYLVELQAAIIKWLDNDDDP